MDNDLMERVHPELRGPLRMMPDMPAMDLSNIEAIRANPMLVTAIDLPGLENIVTEKRLVPGPPGSPQVPVEIYYPPDPSGPLPALLWIHGGGYILGNAEMDAPMTKRLALLASGVVVNVDYRLAPENPYPAPVEDCYAALLWLVSQAAEVGVDPANIAIGGASAGGGLAAALALLARDRGEIEPVFQLLIYPMIDDCNVQPASATRRDAPLWTRQNNLVGWRAYLGHEPGIAGVSCYAAAGRATDLKGLPPAYIAVGELDLFREENVSYAQRLAEAGVLTELHVYPGAFHAFDSIAPDTEIARRFTGDYITALKQALHGPA